MTSVVPSSALQLGSEPRFRVLLLSRLTLTTGFGAFKQIVDSSRSNNAARGLTGALVFDGEHFAHLLEGETGALQALLEVVARDARHDGQTLLHAEPLTGPRLLTVWKSGYCESDELRMFQGTDALQGRPALDAFITLLARCDLVD